MASKLLIGAITVGGLAAGFSLAAAASEAPGTGHHPAAVGEARHLYDTEVALSGEEQHLQALLKLSQAELAAKPAPAAPTASPMTYAATASAARAPSVGPPIVAPAPELSETTTEPLPSAEESPSMTTRSGPPTTTTSTSHPDESGDNGGDGVPETGD